MLSCNVQKGQKLREPLGLLPECIPMVIDMHSEALGS